MPELPEVETIKNDLRPHIEGCRFNSVSIFWPRMVLRPSIGEFKERIHGQVITEVARRGKYLLFRLGSGESLVMHMRMTGSLLLKRKNDTSEETASRYITAIFGLDSGTELLFCDRRKLGTVSLIEDEREVHNKLGPEPLDPDFTPEVMTMMLSRHKAPIKAVLCDQKCIAGIGNMYADEALFFARIHPMRQANSLSEEEVKKLYKAICQVLGKAIGKAGATFSDYRRPGGEEGSQQYAFYVAHRGGETCKICATPIERIPVRKRGTYFCPVCQGSATYS